MALSVHADGPKRANKRANGNTSARRWHYAFTRDGNTRARERQYECTQMAIRAYADSTWSARKREYVNVDSNVRMLTTARVCSMYIYFHRYSQIRVRVPKALILFI